jgi:hypothetical protein
MIHAGHCVSAGHVTLNETECGAADGRLGQQERGQGREREAAGPESQMH